MSTMRRLAAKKDVPTEGRNRIFAAEVEGERIAVLYDQDEGRYLAMQDPCPHRGRPLSEGGGVVVDSCIVICPDHAARFDARTGQPLKGPTQTPAKTYRVVEVGDDLYIEWDDATQA